MSKKTKISIKQNAKGTPLLKAIFLEGRLPLRYKYLLGIKKTFGDIYNENQWGSGSGVGSLPENTKSYRIFLEDFMKKRKIKSVLDIGCGDWQFSKFIKWDDINYTGFDIVRSVIKSNKRKYSKKNIQFYECDILKCKKIPDADLVILKDVLQHWPNKTITSFLPKLKKFKYVLLINDYSNYKTNKNIKIGEWRSLHLNKKPFNLKAKRIYLFHGKEVLLITNDLKNKK
ncbi:class I SAM-dependent methyltransferase [Candidatus Woesearchaeota archaeon]|nr:class I SAM-dependent methyltransferase [Candidatus Woesearchaeota archaeon]